MDDLLLDAVRIRLDPCEGRGETGDFFEWKRERTQKQGFAAVGCDASGRREAGERGKEKEAARIRPSLARRTASSLFTF